MKRIWFLILCTGLLAGADLAGGVRITRSKITLGSSFRLSGGSMAHFEFLVENTDPSPCRVMIRLRQTDSYLASGNNNSPEVSVPGKSSVVYSVPVHLDSSEKYTYEIFVNGIKQRSNVLQNCLVKLTPMQDFCMGLLNDNSEQTDGFYFKTPAGKSAVYNLRASNAPRRKELYESLRLLVIARPDFSAMSAEQYSAVLEYAFSGGTVIFADPEGTLQAAQTPLKALLPLEIRGLYHLHDPADFSFFSDAKVHALPREGVPFLAGTIRPDREVTTLFSIRGFPVLTQMRCGLGTSKVLAFALSDKIFRSSPRFLEKIRGELLYVPDTEKVCNNFSSALNMLTGFAVPSTALIRNILLVYFLGLILILFWGFRKKRTGTAWVLCVCGAVCGTCLILLYARMTIGKRNSLAAVIRLDNTVLPADSSETYMALYSRKAVQTKLLPEGEAQRNILSVIPYHRELGNLQKNPNAQLLDLHVNPRDGMEIRQLHLPVRTSRQILNRKSPSTLPLKDPGPEPVLELGDQGLKLLPWKIPEGREHVENVFMLFPGGSRPVQVDSEGFCSLAEGGEYLFNPLNRELRTALEKSYAKKYPVLVTVSPAGGTDNRKHPLDKEFILQGKILRLYGTDLRVDPKADSLRIPGELLLLSRNDQTGRMILSGNRLRTGQDFQEGQEITLKLSLPSQLRSFRIRNAVLNLTFSNPGNVQFQTLLRTDSGRVLTGKKGQGDSYTFTAGKDHKFRNDITHSCLLTLRSFPALKRKTQSLDMKVARWGLLGLDLTLNGTLESRP